MHEKCEAGCIAFAGGEIRHHKDCVFYPESFSEAYDRLKAENVKLKRFLKRYRNETPLGHQPHMIAAEVDEILEQ